MLRGCMLRFCTKFISFWWKSLPVVTLLWLHSLADIMLINHQSTLWWGTLSRTSPSCACAPCLGAGVAFVSKDMSFSHTILAAITPVFLQGPLVLHVLFQRMRHWKNNYWINWPKKWSLGRVQSSQLVCRLVTSSPFLQQHYTCQYLVLSSLHSMLWFAFSCCSGPSAPW